MIGLIPKTLKPLVDLHVGLTPKRESRPGLTHAWLRTGLHGDKSGSPDRNQLAVATGHFAILADYEPLPVEDFPKVDVKGSSDPGTVGIPSVDLKVSLSEKSKVNVPILHNVLVSVDGENGELITTDLATIGRRKVTPCVVSQRPDIESYFPSHENAEGKKRVPAMMLLFDPGLLSSILSALDKFLGPHCHPTVALKFYSPEDPVELECRGPNGERIAGIVMPKK